MKSIARTNLQFDLLVSGFRERTRDGQTLDAPTRHKHIVPITGTNIRIALILRIIQTIPAAMLGFALVDCHLVIFQMKHIGLSIDAHSPAPSDYVFE